MKKVLVAIVLITLLVSLCACGVSHNSFMSRAKVNQLVKSYPNPQAEVTFKYETAGNNYQVKVTYNLLLDKAPIAVTRFIQLAIDGAYDDTLVDTLDSSKKYVVMGRYQKNAEDGKYYKVRTADVTFAGEFESNEYREPSGGYAQFALYSLAMYHENKGEEFDSANGTLMLALTSDINAANYAVFAEYASMTILTNDVITTENATSRRPQLRDNLLSFSFRTSRDVYDANDPDVSSERISILTTEKSTNVTITVKILGEYDWKKLPTIH